jgi:two-component system, OmpR family, copper resistance phosphate regulon response regulator CusR
VIWKGIANCPCRIKRDDLTTMHEAKGQGRVLVVEDEAKVARALREGLEREKYEVVVAPTGEEGFFLVNAEEFDLVILDLMLPGRDGLQVLATLRKRGLQTPVLILTARDAIEDRVEGLDKGADDYLVKPFAFPELLARVRALLRRGRTEQAVPLRLADLEMDVTSRKARRSGRYLELTAREFELLEYLLRHREQIVSREMLARDVWKETRATPIDNVIDVHINRLRRKVDEPFNPKLIHTVRGVGFVLREES